MRAMCPKRPAKRRWGMHRANILPPRGVFAVRSPQIMHGARILPPSDGLAPCAGVPTPPQRLANTRHLPMPATRCTHYSQRQAADELRWRSFGAWTAVWPSPEGLPTTSSRGQADNGMLCRTGPEFQNREQVGAEPPAESAGPAGPASALPKTPIERANPS